MLQREKTDTDFKQKGKKKTTPENDVRTKTACIDPVQIAVDRMVHYQDLNKRLSDINHFIRTGECPECEAKPVGCSHRAGGDMFCRACGHRWRI